MAFPRLALSLAVLALVFALSTATPAHADSFNTFALGNDNTLSFYGMSSTGLVVLDQASDPSCGFATCYFSYVNGALTTTSSTAPTFAADNGSACSPTLPSGYSAIKAVCNNGHAAWDGTLSPSQSHPGLYDGVSPATTLGDGSGSFLFVNSLGDVVWNDPTLEEWFEAIPATPEPSSLLLLATGIAALATFAYRGVAARGNAPQKSEGL